MAAQPQPPARPSGGRAHAATPAYARLALAAAGALIVLAPAAERLHVALTPGLGVRGALLAAVVLGLLATLLLDRLLAALQRRWPALGGQRPGGLPRSRVVQQLRQLPGFLDVASGQLDGALQDSEQATLQLIERMNEIHRGTLTQFERIECTQSNGQELSRILGEKAMVDAQLGSILQMFVESQEAELKANMERLTRLQEVKALAPMVDAIATVARQTNFLAINSAIEAARAGEQGRSFAVLAAEIRELSNRTGAVAADIGQRIASATNGIDEELAKVMEVSNRQTSTSNMRNVIADIASMQKRFVESMEKLQLDEVIRQVKEGQQVLEGQVTDALNHLQVQDVVRQRVQAAQEAIDRMGRRVDRLASQLASPATAAHAPDGALEDAIAGEIDALRSQQQAIGQAPALALGGAPAGAPQAERIELF